MDFLERVAHRIREKHGGEMEKQIIVLPSRRAGLYLARHISHLSDKPQWAPVMCTVSELFQSFTLLRLASTEEQIFELYRVHNTICSDEISFDDFWSWGDIIIDDFNDIDLYLIDAERLYSNISDLREIDAKFGDLSEEQISIIRSFWKSFNPASTGSEARSRFRSVWQKLGTLYTEFRKAMLAGGIAGNGMICRDVAEKALAGTLDLPEGCTWHVTGLNALNSCEKALFSYLKAKDRARFYWDDGHFFMRDPDHRAGLFMSENNRLFGNDLATEHDHIALRPDGQWVIADTPSDTAQARLLSQIIEGPDIMAGGDLTDTAVILADEKLLLPVLTSLPPAVEEVNVTMGHPFRLTPLYSFLRHLMALIKSARQSDGVITFRCDEVITLLRHQYFRLLSGDGAEKTLSEIISGNMIRIDADFLASRLVMNILFSLPDDGSALPGHLVSIMQMIENKTFSSEERADSMSVDREYLRMAMNETGRIANLMMKYSPSLRMDTCIRLIDKVLRKLVVPFSGEPLRGIQVMGVLETRALEFRNIIFLSLNEGIFPAQSYYNTFIPFNIRRAFGLPTVNEHESIYSYYFFRLLRKPERGWFLYNSTAQGLATGEMSRYLVQMTFSKLFKTDIRSVHIPLGKSRILRDSVPKMPVHNEKLFDLYRSEGKGDRQISPSAVTTWLNCRMRFYFRYVCGMPEEEVVQKDIDQRRFGKILHDALRRLYEPLVGNKETGRELQKLLSDRELIRETVIAAAMREMKWNRATLMAGKGVIIIDVLERYVTDLLSYDAGMSDLTIISLEESYSSYETVACDFGNTEVRIGGRADRTDMKGKVIRVVDYKTGTPRKDKVSLEDLFNEEKERRNDALLQSLLYCHIIRHRHGGKIVIPAIYWVQQISTDEFSPYAALEGINGPEADAAMWNSLMDSLGKGLRTTLNNIFSDKEDYVMTRFVNRCEFCPYRRLCRR